MRLLRGTGSGGDSAKTLLKRSACLAFSFENEGLRCTNYLTGITVASTPILVAILNFFDRWRKLKEIQLLLPGYRATSIRGTLRQLLDHTLVVAKDSPKANREE